MKKIPLKIQNRCKHKKKAICIRVVSTSKGETTTRSNGTLVLAVSVWSHDINHAPTARSFLWQLTGCLEIEIRERASESIRGGQRWQQKKARDSRPFSLGRRTKFEKESGRDDREGSPQKPTPHL